MSGDRQTLDASQDAVFEGGAARPVPGLLLLFGAGRPATVCIPLVDGAVELGRDHAAFDAHSDPRMSRRHVQVRLDHERWTVVDLGSRNGAMVDGEALSPGATVPLSRLLRIGDSLLVPVHDLGPLQRYGVRLRAGRVEGPSSLKVLLAVSLAARLGSTLHITGESGAGKEAVAQAFHAAGPASKGPFQAVNCAAIPEAIAERLLFGARRGAYSGASADADGYLQEADGGTLFLDEIAELAPAVQAKLLRVLETGEVLPLGASRPVKVDLRFCSATHRDLAAHVAAGRFREDLLYRIIAPTIAVPPLRERPEEIPWLLQLAGERTAPDRPIHVSLVEASLLRPWPGNVRELLAEAGSAAQAAAAADAPRIESRHLSTSAGQSIARTGGPQEPTPVATPVPAPAQAPVRTPRRQRPRPTSEELEAALQQHARSIRATAKHFECDRKQIRAWIRHYAIATPTDDEAR